MRDFLDSILAIIGTTSLTNAEFVAFPDIAQEYSVEVYEGLLAVIDARETVSNTRDRLRYYFLARGVEVEESDAGQSNIYIGGVL